MRIYAVFSTDSDSPRNSASKSASDPNEADVCLDIRQDARVTFETCDPLLKKHGISTLPYHTTVFDAESVRSVLSSAEAWFLHVKNTNQNNPLKAQLRIEFFKVVADPLQLNQDWMKPEGNNLNSSGVVTIEANPYEYYGVKVVNESNYDLHAYLFYFGVSELNIDSYNRGPVPVRRGQANFSLRKRSTYSMGHGAAGVLPFAYQLGEGQTQDVGIIKLFVTTWPANFEMLAQESPFNKARGDPETPSEEERANISPMVIRRSLEEQQEYQWDTQQMVLVQKAIGSK
ncbi:hypothetical protein FRC12_018351 [Ceratobasidium sp. 428]|nr:hypothetical protein FRC12_018351 [Ceratobasidium sp. 428]